MIDITPADQEIVTAILKKYVPHAEVRVFGSRHKWTAKPYSDLDLAIVADAKLDKQLIYDLEEAFEESELSFRVDVIDWYAISDEFQAIIEQGYTVIQEKIKALPTGWVVKRLDDIVYYVKDKIKVGTLSTHDYVSTENMLSNCGGIVASSSLPNIGNATKYAQNDILISNIRPYFKKIWLASKNGGCSNDVLVLRNKDNDSFYNEFLYYYLTTDHFFDYVMAGSKGTKMPRGDKSQILKYKMVIPPIEEQKEIAAILSSLDDKIELNQQINKKLEEMAQAIFKEWFIDFNFPDENGNPYRDSGGAMIDSELGQIPAYWSVGKLGEEFNITMGQSPVGSSYNESKEGMIFFQGRTDFGTRFPSIRLFTTEPKRIAKKFDILLSVRAPVGDINIALQYCCIGRGLAAINAENKSYCYYKLQFLQQQFNIYNGTGTVFGAINKDQLHGLSVVIATQNVVRNFEDVVSKIDEKIYHNHLEILNLQNTRDTLLPKLLSGEILA